MLLLYHYIHCYYAEYCKQIVELWTREQGVRFHPRIEIRGFPAHGDKQRSPISGRIC